MSLRESSNSMRFDGVREGLNTGIIPKFNPIFLTDSVGMASGALVFHFIVDDFYTFSQSMTYKGR